jgi:hypothetical protein
MITTYLVVAFFCVAEDRCSFWKGPQMHYSQAVCQKELVQAAHVFTNAKIKAYLSCIPIPIGKEA